ncbi:hypothetical protein BBF96_01290 [Anoxybacter fermentans]|uniref:CDP-alcohol phosphatidyltransferase n=1 Tax=Anoxybacter fermentans TaxID=1323375 RepID=A0A3Q9HNK1_9FIRM|nr:CDP-alcohol phosphatidyltransferase family protein [Anoxybacter fermentans]AZR72146.1 hypothetical protein BBF96_01290 [Anoxybacter fermentans]
MLDTHARHLLQPLFDKTAYVLYRIGIKANQLTIMALVIGVGAGVSFYFGHPWLAVVLLWLSGLMDVLDGSLARLGKESSAWGGFMDIIFDRTVETAVIIFYGLVFPDARMGLVVLLSSIVFCISIFLTVGALAEKRGIKEFYHQAGITERTETFIFFTLFFLFPTLRNFWIYLFAILIYFTGGQRFVEAYRLFGKAKSHREERN